MLHPLRFRSLALGAAVCLIALAQVVGYFRSSPIPTPNLDLRIDRQPTGILVSWNHKAAELSAATSAVLTISGEQRTRAVNLSPRELRETDIFYPADGSDLKVELQVNGERGGFSQYVRVAGGKPVSTSPVVETQSTPPMQASFQAPTPAPEAPARGLFPKRNQIPGAPSFQAPVAQHGPVPRNVADVEPPSFTPILPTSLPTELSTVELPSRAPASAQPQSERFVPARPLKQVQPSLRTTALGVPLDTALSQTSRTYVLEVRVNLDARGKVRGVKLERTTGPYSAQLWEAVVDAAARTPFAPATRDGRPVASTQTLRFELRPQR